MLKLFESSQKLRFKSNEKLLTKIVIAMIQCQVRKWDFSFMSFVQIEFLSILFCNFFFFLQYYWARSFMSYKIYQMKF